MISGLDHVVVLIDDIGKGAANYEALFGCLPSWQTAVPAPTAYCSPCTT